MRDWDLRCQKFMEKYSLRCVLEYVYIGAMDKNEKIKYNWNAGSFQVNKSKHILSKPLLLSKRQSTWSALKRKQTAAKNKAKYSIRNSQFMSKTKLVSFGSTSFVFSAWHVKIEFKSDLCTDGHRRRFSITSPELCSYWSSTCKPFISQRTWGCGRPVNEKWNRKHELKCCVKSLLVELKRQIMLILFWVKSGSCPGKVSTQLSRWNSRWNECKMAKKGKVADEKDLIAFLCKLNSILIASTTMKNSRLLHWKSFYSVNFSLVFPFFIFFFSLSTFCVCSFSALAQWTAKNTFVFCRRCRRK